MSAVVRLLRIEARRNPGLWLVPLVTASTVAATISILPKGIWLWLQTSVSIRETAILVGPLVAGLSTWAAGRNRRRGIEELLAATPRPAASRDFVAWGGAAVWHGLAYALAAGLVLLFAYVGGAWGSPVLWPVLLGLLAVLTLSAIGYAVGYYIRNRLATPLVAVATYLVLGFTADSAGNLMENPRITYLSPIAGLAGSVFYGVQPNVFFEQSLWLLGLAGAALAAVALKWRRSVGAWCALLAAMAVAALGSSMLLLQTPLGPVQGQMEEARASYEPVCAEGGRLPVCVHPAYEKMLPETAAVVRDVAAPLVGVPGGPTSAEQDPEHRGFSPDGPLPFFLYDSNSGGQALAEALAVELTRSPSPASPGEPEAILNDAQAAFAAWLLEQADVDPDFAIYVSSSPEAVRSTAERFAALDPARREKWILDHYAGLRAGELTLEDFPS